MIFCPHLLLRRLKCLLLVKLCSNTHSARCAHLVFNKLRFSALASSAIAPALLYLWHPCRRARSFDSSCNTTSIRLKTS